MRRWRRMVAVATSLFKLPNLVALSIKNLHIAFLKKNVTFATRVSSAKANGFNNSIVPYSTLPKMDVTYFLNNLKVKFFLLVLVYPSLIKFVQF